jgi:hypothetical protein
MQTKKDKPSRKSEREALREAFAAMARNQRNPARGTPGRAGRRTK